VYLDESYHGSFAASISVSGLIPLRELFQPRETGATAVPTPNPAHCPKDRSLTDFALECAAALEAEVRKGDVAAFIFEPVLGSAGIVVPPPEYFARVKEICKEHDVLLIADEVATGFGRTGRWFACEHYGLEPDIMTLAKGINSGYLPLGAVLFSGAIEERFKRSGLPVLHGSTYNGHPVCCASGLANIEIIRRERLVERSRTTGAYFQGRLEELLALQAVTQIRGLGLMLGAALVQQDGTPATIAQLYELMLTIRAHGVIVYIEKSTLMFCPALTISEAEIDTVVDTLHAVLSSVQLDGGKVLPATADLAV
jgi:adenosylmethionine-8-amino-7-oxononanoate aminotransferase